MPTHVHPCPPMPTRARHALREATDAHRIARGAAHRMRSSKLEQYEDKVARLNDEIFYAADGSSLSDLEYVSDMHDDEEAEQSD